MREIKSSGRKRSPWLVGWLVRCIIGWPSLGGSCKIKQLQLPHFGRGMGERLGLTCLLACYASIIIIIISITT
jgi:hypothetical protein